MTELKAGRQLDALVAEHLMGWKHYRSGNEAFTYDTLVPPEYDGSDLQYLGMIIPRYSTNIADAWLIIERMRKAGWHYEVGNHRNLAFECVRFGRGDYDRHEDEYSEECARCAETAPLAICLAVLEAAGYTEESEVK